MLKYFIPTYSDCLNIVYNNPPKTFYEKRKLFEGYDFSIFSYQTAEYKNFKNPLKDFPEITAFEMKGLTFLHHEGKTFHSLMFNKFWELNQYPEFSYDNFKDKKIKRIMVKEDGNLISFVRLPDGRIFSRVKEGFKSSFNKTANEFYNTHDKYQKFISYCLDNNIVPLFELVGENRIVLKYEENNLFLLNLRNNITGEYIDWESLDYDLDGINIIKNETQYSFDDLISMAKEKEEFEGWVVQFEDDMLLKVKTKWYYGMTDFMLEQRGRERKKNYK